MRWNAHEDFQVLEWMGRSGTIGHHPEEFQALAGFSSRFEPGCARWCPMVLTQPPWTCPVQISERCHPAEVCVSVGRSGFPRLPNPSPVWYTCKPHWFCDLVWRRILEMDTQDRPAASTESFSPGAGVHVHTSTHRSAHPPLGCAGPLTQSSQRAYTSVKLRVSCD